MVRRRAPSRRHLFTIALCLGTSCSPGFDEAAVQQRLLAREQELLRQDNADNLPEASEIFGADPYRVRALPGGARYLLLHRNTSELLLLDEAFRVLAREPTPRAPTGWAMVRDGSVFVGGAQSATIQRYEIRDDGLVRQGEFALEPGSTVQDLVFVEATDRVFALDDTGHRLIGIDANEGMGSRQHAFALGKRPIQIQHVAGHLVINQLLDHNLLVVPLEGGAPDFEQTTRIAHDGPFWAFDAVARGDTLSIVATGIEDRPLDRAGGEFGYVDSFLFLYILVPGRAARPVVSPADTINLSALGVVTPKAVRVEREGVGYRVWVAGYGSGGVAEVPLDSHRFGPARIHPAPPGTSDFVVQAGDSGTTLVAANPLLDRVYRGTVPSGESRQLSWQAVYPPQPAITKRNASSHLGEVLFFTTLLTPHNRSDGALSRFTCEACHFEGGIDGRVHYTGRENIHATTKTLRGMRNNVPLFTRGGDRSLASMVMAEFRAANQGDDHAVAIPTADHPWLDAIAGMPDTLTPETQRRAFLQFLMDFRHEPNPRRHSAPMDSLARAGLTVFKDRCAHCHQPRPSTREGAVAAPLDSWVDWLESPDRDLVWGAPFFSKTGIEPYVRAAGARVPSLRRVAAKYPYFTNGSAPTLREVLLRFRYRGLTAWHAYPSHDDGPAPGALAPADIEGLLAALRWF